MLLLSAWKKKAKRIILARNVIEENPNCNLNILSKVLHISRWLLYYESKMDIKDESFRESLESVNNEHPFYWHRRIAWSLDWSLKKARRLMKKFWVSAITRKTRKFLKRDDIWAPEMDVPNLIKDIEVVRPNQIWKSDFTFLRYRWIFFYLATILDDFTKEIIWYSLSIRHTKEFVLYAIKDALKKKRSIPDIFHSDQWSEYRSYLVLEFLKSNSIQASMSKKWSPWENWSQESYYSRFKLEIWDLNRYESFEEAIEAIHHQIFYYNNHRIHSKHKMPPVEARKRYEIMMLNQ